MKQTAICLAIILFSCRSLVTIYEDVESAIYYEDASQESVEFNNTLKVMTWNVRFGAARIPWFGDSCGDRVLMTESEVFINMDSIIAFIQIEQPDILLLQEVDVSSKRSAYMNQVQYILDNTYLKYGAYASMWDAEIIPSDGLGKVDVGNAILSRWEISEAERIQLPLRTDQDALTQYFYLRRNILKAKITLFENTGIYAVNIHATAFATDDTKQKHIAKYKEVLNELESQGAVFITGGDLNSIPPSAGTYDFCKEDECEDENWHSLDDVQGPHKEGSYFNNFEATDQYPGELNLLQPFYEDALIYSAINYSDRNLSDNFTHSTWNIDQTSIDEFWDRKLDYLFTNYQDWSTTGETHNDIDKISDHAPISATLNFLNP